MVNTRRKTLGSMQNRRATMAPVPNPTEVKPKPRGRKSMAPRIAGSSGSELYHTSTSSQHNSGRRKTLGGDRDRDPTPMARTSLAPPPTTTLMEDPRPINDKKYINSCIRKLHNYLTENGYENQVRLKDLSRPSAKDFHNFVTFLLQRINPNFPDATKKIEDEIALAFKSLGYPFNISKTALVAAGSSHTWPTLLLALTWVIELLESDVDDFNDDDNDTENGILRAGAPGQPLQDLQVLQERTEDAFIKYLEGSYNSFLSGDDVRMAKFSEDLLLYMEKDDEVIESEIEAFSLENEAIIKAINDAGKEIEDLPQRQTRLEELATDIEQFHELVRQLNEQKEARTQKVAEQRAELDKKEKQLQEKEDRGKQLRLTIETQELSLADVREIEAEHMQLKSKLDKITRVKQVHDEKALQTLTDLKKNFAKLEALSYSGFNADIGSKGLKDKYGRKLKTNIELHMDRAHEEKTIGMFGGVDFKSGIIPLLTDQKDYFERQYSDIREEELKATDAIESLTQKESEITDASKVLEKRIQREETEFDRLTKEHESMHSIKLQELQSVEDKVSALRNPVEIKATIARYTRQCIELDEQRKRNNEESLMLKQAVLSEINNALTTCAEYKELQDKTIKKVKSFISACDIPNIELSESDTQKLSSY